MITPSQDCFSLDLRLDSNQIPSRVLPGQLAHPWMMDPPPTDPMDSMLPTRPTPQSFPSRRMMFSRRQHTHLDHLGQRKRRKSGSPLPVPSDCSSIANARAVCAPLKCLAECSGGDKGTRFGRHVHLERLGKVEQRVIGARVTVQGSRGGPSRSPPPKVPSNWGHYVLTHCPVFKGWVPPPLYLLSKGSQDIGRATLFPLLSSMTRPA